jgi:hypothetical protein
LTPNDYRLNFGITNWAEIQPNYEVNFQDIAIKSDSQTYETSITVSGNNGKNLYLLIDTTNSRLIKGCPGPFSVNSLYAVTPSGSKVYASWGKMKIAGAQDGVYKIYAKVTRNVPYH